MLPPFLLRVGLSSPELALLLFRIVVLLLIALLTFLYLWLVRPFLALLYFYLLLITQC